MKNRDNSENKEITVYESKTFQARISKELQTPLHLWAVVHGCTISSVVSEVVKRFLEEENFVENDYAWLHSEKQSHKNEDKM